MATKLNISEQEYERLRRSGMSKEQIIAKHSGSAELPIMSGAKKITNALGLKGTVDTLGTNIAQITNVLDPRLSLEQKYQRSQDIGQTTLKQNIGAGAQLASIANPLGTGSSFARTLGIGTLQGAAAFGGQAAAENKSGSTITRQTAIGGGLGAALTVGARAIQGIGEAAFKYFIPRSKQEAILLQTYKANKPFAQRIQDAALDASTAPRSVSDTAFEKGIMGTESMMGIQAKRAQSNLWDKLIKPQLDSVKEQIDLNQFFAAAREKIIKETPELTRQKELLKALDSIVEDYADTSAISLAKLQDLKKGWAEFVPEKAYRGENIAGALNDVRDTLSHNARQFIYDKLGGGVRTAYLDYGNLEGLKKLGQSAMTGQKLKGGSGGLINAIIEKVMVPISTVGGMTTYKVGQGIELVGRPGLNTVGQFILDLTSESDPQQDTEAIQQETPPELQSSEQTTPSKTRVNDDGTITTVGPFSGKEITFDPSAVAGTVKLAKGMVPVLTEALKKAQPVHYELIGDFLKRFETKDLNTQMLLLDNYENLFTKLGLNKLDPDDLKDVLNRMMQVVE